MSLKLTRIDQNAFKKNLYDIVRIKIKNCLSSTNFRFSFQSLLKTADQLKIKGLCEVSEDKDPQTPDDYESPVSPRVVSKLRRVPIKRPRSSENIKKQHEVKTPKLTDTEDEKEKLVDEETEPSNEKQKTMTGHSLLPAQALFPQLCVDSEEFPPEPPGPAATPVRHVEMNHECSPPRTLLTNTDSSQRGELIETSLGHDIVKVKLETLKGSDHGDTQDLDSRMSSHSMGSHGSEDEQGMHTMMITPELMGLIPTSSLHAGDEVFLSNTSS